METFIHLKSTLNECVNTVVNAIFTSGVLQPLTDCIFGASMKDIKESAITQVLVQSRLSSVLEYLGDQLVVLYSALYSGREEFTFPTQFLPYLIMKPFHSLYSFIYI